MPLKKDLSHAHKLEVNYGNSIDKFLIFICFFLFSLMLEHECFFSLIMWLKCDKKLRKNR